MKKRKASRCGICQSLTDRIDEQFNVFVCSKPCEEELHDQIIREMEENGEFN